ncbi:iron reductase domain protein [Bipolaris zeicola 26-R-13]|uniref:Iron reductase domain protein n=1 Tax=Cochliobolus carbonum (strain 26-R-13) TaxID=930089 RepID=W6XS18_COCC2|nr:iron reductase domain protein [Bipolaris zeicola 26-R-13]EUC30277.1 iron reductase domain protein [Bipolaris zeicola 26-R-13]
MRYTQIIGSAVLFLGCTLAQEGEAQSTVVYDAETKISYSSYTEPATGMTFGVALPKNVTDPYNAIIRITAPVTNQWVGFSWGGNMVWNPLSVAWPNGQSGVVSSRFAFGIGLPLGYDGAEHTYLKGTRTNTTHWTVNALCKGCTGWQNSEDARYSLNDTGTTEFAWAYGTSAVEDAARNNSAFNVHQAWGKWIHNLDAARINNFDSLVRANLLTGPIASPSADLTTVVTSIVPSATAKPVATATIPASCSGAGNPAFQGNLAAGWKATKIAGGMTSPRSIQFDNAGNMLVVQSGKGISYHKMGADGCVTSTKMLISQSNLNHGIALSHDGKTLYASSMTQVYAWPYDAAAGTLGTRTTVVTGMYNGGSHLTRTLAIAPQNSSLLVVSHGSNSNIDQPTSDPKTGRAIIKVFNLANVPSGGYNYVSGGYNAGYGQRNEVGICFDSNNMLWGVENSGDDFKRNGKDIHNDNPGEKIHYMGDVSLPNNAWYGYPSCFTVWKPSDFTDKAFKVGDWFTQSPSSTLNDDTCVQKATPPKLTLQPHSAPIDCKFDANSTTMYVTYHGSWNRQPVTGFKLVAVKFKRSADGGITPVEPLTSTTAAQDVFFNPAVEKCQGNGPGYSSGCFRPAGLAWDGVGRLYMTSDTSSNGEIWILGQS